MNLQEANKAFRVLDWDDLTTQGDGTHFAVLVDNEAFLGKVVEIIEKEDHYDDRVVTVTVEVNGQFFQRTGTVRNESHCYGDYETSWNELREVKPVQKMVTLYEIL
jgi:hypothetical protein